MQHKRLLCRAVIRGGDVVKSPHIERMVASYRVASGGRVIVMCSPTDTGKTIAAEFFVHGKHPFRPERSLMISAAGMEDVETEFSSLILGFEGVGPFLGEYLCSALVSRVSAESDSAAKLVAKAGDAMDTVLYTAQEKHPFVASKEINMYGPEKVPSPTHVRQGLPVLIINDFNKATAENKKFVEKLFQVAARDKVFVFILTTVERWATTLVGLNGGSKIKPLHGNVDNANYIITGPFPTGEVPRWNSLGWPVATLRELIRPFCVKHSIDPVTVVPDGAEMTPVMANDRALQAAGY